MLLFPSYSLRMALKVWVYDICIFIVLYFNALPQHFNGSDFIFFQLFG